MHLHFRKDSLSVELPPWKASLTILFKFPIVQKNLKLALSEESKMRRKLLVNISEKQKGREKKMLE